MFEIDITLSPQRSDHNDNLFALEWFVTYKWSPLLSWVAFFPSSLLSSLPSSHSPSLPSFHSICYWPDTLCWSWGGHEEGWSFHTWGAHGLIEKITQGVNSKAWEAEPGMASGSGVGERWLGDSTETMNDHLVAHFIIGFYPPMLYQELIVFIVMSLDLDTRLA